MSRKHVPDEMIRERNNHGWTPRAIAHDLGVSLRRVCRVVSDGQSAQAATRVKQRKAQALETPQQRRMLHMVPDDRLDEGIDYAAAIGEAEAG